MPKFVQVSANTHGGVFAVDDLGRVWFTDHHTVTKARGAPDEWWEAWSLLPACPPADATPQPRDRSKKAAV